MRATTRRRAEDLAALLEGRPVEADPGVHRLVEVAGQVAQQPRPTLSAEARDRIRDRVLAEIHLEAADAAASTTSTTRRARPRVAVASGVASALVVAGGVTVAAQEALPGEALYSVKRASETVRIAVASDQVETSRLQLRLAQERLEELTTAAERGSSRSASLIDALGAMDRRSIDGVEGLVAAAERDQDPQLLAEAATFTATQSGGLEVIYRDLPPAVRPHAEDSLAILRALRTEIIDPAVARCTGCEEIVPAGDARPEPEPVTSPVPDTATTPTEAPSGPTATEPDGATDPGQGSSGPSAPRPQLPDGDDLPRLDRAPRSGGGQLLPRITTGLDDVTDGVGDVLEGTTDGVGDVLEGTTDGVGDVLESTTDGVGDVLEGTTDAVGGLLDGLTRGLTDGRSRDRGDGDLPDGDLGLTD